ncbi:hypothetical protein [Oceanicella sp. SM1341]|uniref:hypothetical protein n=1 Tax=Oceanicella sp. SM1341 TaxID=1548889 RepID=UPI00130092B4|nr:hypothetical protein [Oceanicella sp. SM1341]
MSRLPRLGLFAALACRDLAHGWLSTACLALGAMIAMAPLLLLFGLNHGFVSGLIAQLREDPRTRELTPVGQYTLDAAWFERLQADPRTGFLLPRTRYLASSAVLRAATAEGVAEVELVPTAAGDPLLPPALAVTTPGEAVLSASAAAALGLAPGDAVSFVFTRRVGSARESFRHEARVLHVLDRGLAQRDTALIHPRLLDAVERWREGGPPPDLAAAPEPGRSWASFRLFARDVRDVPALRDALVSQGMDVRTEAADIARALAIETGLGWVFSVILVLTTAGVMLTLGFQLAAATAEKSGELSLLRMLGAAGAELQLFPMVQGALLAGAGALAAGLAVLAAQGQVNARLAGIAGFDGPMSLLTPGHVAAATALALLGGAVSGAVAGRHAARLEPSEGLRRD